MEVDDENGWMGKNDRNNGMAGKMGTVGKLGSMEVLLKLVKVKKFGRIAVVEGSRGIDTKSKVE